MDIIYDNIVFALQKTGGISVYWSELLNRAITNKNVKIFERPEVHANLQRGDLNIPPNLIIQEPKTLPVQLARYLPARTSITAQALFHSSYYRVSQTHKAVNIVTVHDFIYEYFAHGLRRQIHLLQKSYAIKHASMLICYSQHTKQELLHFFPETDPDRIRVIPLAANNKFKPLTPDTQLPLSLKQLQGIQYLVYIGARDSYKNFSLAIETASQLSGVYLVVVGGKSISHREHKRLHQKLADRYFHISGVSSEELNIVYNKAICLLYPSEHEGFGIPPLEAMQAGCPVVAVHTASLPEVCGDAALLASKPCAAEFVAHIHSLEKGERREAFRTAGIAQAAKFSWDKTYAETLDCYEQALLLPPK